MMFMSIGKKFRLKKKKNEYCKNQQGEYLMHFCPKFCVGAYQTEVCTLCPNSPSLFQAVKLPEKQPGSFPELRADGGWNAYTRVFFTPFF